MSSFKVQPEHIDLLVKIAGSVFNSIMEARKRRGAGGVARIDTRTIRRALLARLEAEGVLETPAEIRARVRREQGLPENDGQMVIRHGESDQSVLPGVSEWDSSPEVEEDDEE